MAPGPLTGGRSRGNGLIEPVALSRATPLTAGVIMMLVGHVVGGLALFDRSEYTEVR